VLIAIAAVLGLLAAGLVYVRLGRGGADHVIVVATGDLEAGSAIGAEKIKAVPWATSVVPEGAFEDPKLVVGRIARMPIATGQPIMESNLAKPDAKSGLTSVINEGWRAISVEADEVSGVAGFIMPGSYVDVLVSGKDMAGASFSKIVLQYVRVLAVEQDTKADPEQPRVVRAVTLELSPEQSERLDLARSVGKLSLALRNQFDKRPSISRGARLNDLMAGAGNPAPTPSASPQPAAPSAGRAMPTAARPASAQPVRSVAQVEEIRGTGNPVGAN
jgi:pilus assembly protein CpaB